MLGDDRPAYRGFQPKRPFDRKEKGWGALEFKARYAELDVDDASFPVFANPDTQASEARAVGAGVNWYLDRTMGGFPTVGIVSLPLWIYKSLMLLWALWLAASLLRWLRWGFNAFRDGGAWRHSAPKPRVEIPRTENPRVPIEQIEAAKAALAKPLSPEKDA